MNGLRFNHQLYELLALRIQTDINHIRKTSTNRRKTIKSKRVIPTDMAYLDKETILSLLDITQYNAYVKRTGFENSDN